MSLDILIFSPFTHTLMRRTAFLISALLLLIEHGTLQAQRAASKDGYVITADSARLYYRSVGSGKDTIIALHGGPGVDLESIYEDFLPLAERHTVVFYDQRGAGRSTLPRDSSTLNAAQQISDLDAIRRSLRLERITLVAHSYGPLLAATYAIAHPGVVERMIFLGPVPPRRGDFWQRFGRSMQTKLDSTQRARLVDANRRLNDTKASPNDRRQACRDYWGIAMRPRLAEPDRSPSVIRADLCASNIDGIQYGLARTNPAVMSSYGDWDIRPALKQVRAPTLILHGEEESIPMDLVEEWTTALPNATLIRVPRAAHFPYAERPELVWPAVERFLTARGPVAAPASEKGDVEGAKRLFSAWLDGQIAYRGLPGVVVGVVADQELVWAQGFGHADVQAKRAMTPATKFRMASHSKLFTATAIMQLREQGKLGLDDPASKYLPWFRVKPSDPGDPPITIAELLSHSSGLPREAGPHWTTYDFPTQDQLRTLTVQRQAAFAPEVRWKYSNLAYSVAGMVVEAVSGEKWADYIQKNIYQPLGMTASSVDANVSGLAVGYGRRMPDGSRAIMPFVDARGMGAATGITSTVEDMAKFVSAQFRKGPRSGRQILSTASLREMHRVRMLENSWTQGSAIGFAVNRVRDKVFVGHGGGYPGYTTQTLIQLDDKVGVIVLTNTNDSNPSDIANQLMSTVGEAVAKAYAVKPKAIAWDPAWARFAGLYRGQGGDAHVVLMNEQLVIITPNAANLENRTHLEPIGGGQFRWTAPGGGGPVGEVVRFIEENGAVVRMITGDSYVDRVKE